MRRKKEAEALLLKVKPGLNVEYIKSVLTENVRAYNKTVESYQQLNENLLFNTPYQVSDNLELFLFRNFDKYTFNKRDVKYRTLYKNFVGNPDELYWLVTNSGAFIKTQKELKELDKLTDSGYEEFAQDYDATTKYFRNRKEEFLLANNNAEVLKKLRGFWIVNTLRVALPEKLMEMLKYDLRIRAKVWK